VKIAAKQLESFLRKGAEEMHAVLFYGPNGGLVHEAADRLAKAIAPPEDPFRSAELSVNDVKSEPARLFDEAQALSLGGGRRVVRLREANDGASAAVEAWLPEAGGDTLVILEAGELAARSSLRKLFEAAKNAAAVPCYAEEEDSAQDIITSVLADHDLKIESDALAYLLGVLGDDRLIMRGEAEKLALFARGKDRVMLADAEAAVVDSAQTSLEAVALAAASGDVDALDRGLARAYRGGLDPVSLVRAVANHLVRLHLVLGQIEEGMAEGRALESLKPPLFFKTRPVFQRQLGQWSTERLAQALELLIEAEARCKTTAIPSEALCSHTLLRIATAAREPRA